MSFHPYLYLIFIEKTLPLVHVIILTEDGCGSIVDYALRQSLCNAQAYCMMNVVARQGQFVLPN